MSTTTVRIPYEPFPVFVPFHNSKALECWLFGAFASGKTIALAGDAIEHGASQYGSRIVMSRLTIGSLRDTLEHEFINLLSYTESDKEVPLWQLCKTIRANTHYETVVFPNGTVYKFLGLDDWKKKMGYSVSGFYVDEASEVPEETYVQIATSRVRQQQITPEARELHYRERPQAQWKHRIRGAQNPAGKDWAYRRFVDITPDERERLFKMGTGREYHRSTAFDNPTLFLPDGSPTPFLQGMMNMPEQWKKRYLYCQFDEFAGSILDFSQEHHVHPHFDPPDYWKRVMGFDWGLRNPAAASWWAQDPNTGTWYKYREWMSHDPGESMRPDPDRVMSATEVARRIRQLEGGERIHMRIADPDIRKRHPTGETTKSVETFLNHEGLFFQLGSQYEEVRINSQLYMLHSGRAKIMDNCPISIRQYTSYRWEDITPQVSGREKEVRTRARKVDDHLLNADQYIFTKFMPGTPELRPERSYTSKEEAHEEMIRQRIAEQVRRNLHNKGKKKPTQRFGPALR